jgi:hypothetical protein
MSGIGFSWLMILAVLLMISICIEVYALSERVDFPYEYSKVISYGFIITAYVVGALTGGIAIYLWPT